MRTSMLCYNVPYDACQPVSSILDRLPLRERPRWPTTSKTRPGATESRPCAVDAWLGQRLKRLFLKHDDAGTVAQHGDPLRHHLSPATILIEHHGQQAVMMGGTALPARRQADGALSVATLPGDLRIMTVHEAAAAVTLEVRELGLRDRLERVEPEQETAAPLAGRYGNAAAGRVATIAHDPEGPAMFRMSGNLGGLEYAMTPIGPRLWQAKATSALPLVLTLGGVPGLKSIDHEGCLAGRAMQGFAMRSRVILYGGQPVSRKT